LWTTAAASAVAAQVTGKVRVAAANGVARANHDAGVVVCLTPLTGQAALRPSAQSESPHPKLIQKNKVFDPHVLAVQVGS
jgi:hypothetical protein